MLSIMPGKIFMHMLSSTMRSLTEYALSFQGGNFQCKKNVKEHQYKIFCAKKNNYNTKTSIRKYFNHNIKCDYWGLHTNIDVYTHHAEIVSH